MLLPLLAEVAAVIWSAALKVKVSTTPEAAGKVSVVRLELAGLTFRIMAGGTDTRPRAPRSVMHPFGGKNWEPKSCG
jgi:hypothetical protein